MNTLRFFFRVMALTGLAFITIACTQASSSQVSTTPPVSTSRPTTSATGQATTTPMPEQPTPTGTLTGVIASADNVGPVPQGCPPGPAPRNVDPAEFAPVVGGSPVWATGFEGPHATIYLQGALSDVHGWAMKILWSIGPNYTGTVTLQGGNLRDGSPLWLGADGAQGQDPSTTLILDPHHPGTITGSDHGWAEFPGVMDIPQAGCYYLQAHWPGGSWSITFAAGL